jgi:tetratricopeptide (TPR) repeat protein
MHSLALCSAVALTLLTLPSCEPKQRSPIILRQAGMAGNAPVPSAAGTTAATIGAPHNGPSAPKPSRYVLAAGRESIARAVERADYALAYQAMLTQEAQPASCESRFYLGHLATLAGKSAEAETWFQSVPETFPTCLLAERATGRALELALKQKTKSTVESHARWLLQRDTAPELRGDPGLWLNLLRAKVKHPMLRALSARVQTSPTPGSLSRPGAEQASPETSVATAPTSTSAPTLASNTTTPATGAPLATSADNETALVAELQHYLAVHGRGGRGGEAALLLVELDVDAKRFDRAISTLKRLATEGIGFDQSKASDLAEHIPPNLRGNYPLGLDAEDYGKRLMQIATLSRDVVVAESNRILRDAKASPLAQCRARLAIAMSGSNRKKSEQMGAWQDAAASCRDHAEDESAQAAYNGGKTAVSAGQKDEAVALFEQVERTAPKSRLADDARVRRAMALTTRNEEAKALVELEQVDALYPQGDMKHEARFRAGLIAFARKDWARAADNFVKADAFRSLDTNQGSRGRSRYFLGRTYEMQNRVEDAYAEYMHVIRTYPLSYSMALAARGLDRLRNVPANAPAASRPGLREVESALSGQRGARPFLGPTFPNEGTAIDPTSVQRAVKLIELDDLEGAKIELTRLGAWGDESSASGVEYGAQIFAGAELWDVSHAPFRSKRLEHEAAFPLPAQTSSWQLAYPAAYAPLVLASCKNVDLSPALAFGIMREESAFLPRVKSHAGALGLMQLMPTTAAMVARSTTLVPSEDNLRTPEVNIALGTKLLSSLRAKYRHPAMAIAAYNAGEGAVSGWLSSGRIATDADLAVEQIPYEETRNYVKRVLSSTIAYAALYDRPSLGEWLGMPDTVR